MPNFCFFFFWTRLEKCFGKLFQQGSLAGVFCCSFQFESLYISAYNKITNS